MQHTLIAQAENEINGFRELSQKFEKKLSILGRSRSTYLNYISQFAKLTLHFKCLPTELDEEQLTDYLRDLDFDRKMLHVYQGKGKKGRYVLLSGQLIRGLKKYISSEKPEDWLFNGKLYITTKVCENNYTETYEDDIFKKN